MTYKEKLLDPRWKKKRLEILERDRHRCKICGVGIEEEIPNPDFMCEHTCDDCYSGDIDKKEYCRNYCNDPDAYIKIKYKLHVHHKKYIYGIEPWDYENIYLITLCEDCHRKETLKQKCIIIGDNNEMVSA